MTIDEQTVFDKAANGQQQGGDSVNRVAEAIKGLDTRLSELTRVAERLFGAKPGTSGIAGQRPGVQGADAGEVDPNARRGEKLSPHERAQADQGGFAYVKAQRIANLGQSTVNAIGDRYKSNTERMMDMTVAGGEFAAGMGASTVARAFGASDPQQQMAGEFAATAARSMLESAMQANRMRIDEMRGGMQGLEDLAASGATISDDTMARAASHFDAKAQRRSRFRQRTAGHIDEQLARNPGDDAFNQINAGFQRMFNPEGMERLKRETTEGQTRSQTDEQKLSQSMDRLRQAIERNSELPNP